MTGSPMIPLSQITSLSHPPRDAKISLAGWLRLAIALAILIAVIVLQIDWISSSRTNRTDVELHALFYILIPTVWLGYAMYSTLRNLAFARQCRMAQGSISGLYADQYQNQRGTNNFYKMEYSFRVGEERFRREVSSSWWFNQTHSSGQTVIVFFDPLDPNTSRLSRELADVSTTLGVNLPNIQDRW